MIIKLDLNKICYILLVKIKRYLKYKYCFDGFILFKKKEKEWIFKYFCIFDWNSLLKMIEVFMKFFFFILDFSVYVYYVFNIFDYDWNGFLSFEVSLIFCFELY